MNKNPTLFQIKILLAQQTTKQNQIWCVCFDWDEKLFNFIESASQLFTLNNITGIKTTHQHM